MTVHTIHPTNKGSVWGYIGTYDCPYFLLAQFLLLTNEPMNETTQLQLYNLMMCKDDNPGSNYFKGDN